jgi:hypothetical protein
MHDVINLHVCDQSFGHLSHMLRKCTTEDLMIANSILTPMKSKLHALKNVWTYNGSLFNYLYFSKVKCSTINIC